MPHSLDVYVFPVAEFKVFSISSVFSLVAFRSPLELQNVMSRYACTCVILFNSIPVILNLSGLLILSYAIALNLKSLRITCSTG